MGRTYKIILWAAGILGFVCVGIFFYYIYLYSTFTDVQETVKSQLSSNVGDFISGTIGTILAFISTLFLFVTFRVQQVQFEKNQLDAYRQRFEGTFFNIMSMLYQVRTEVNQQICLNSKLKSKNLFEFYHSFVDFYDHKLDKEADFKEAMTILLKDNYQKTELETAMYDLGHAYDEYVESQGCNAGFFFRYIHNLITFVIHHWGGEKQKDVAIGYLNFIQAQLTNEELALLFYDSISRNGMDKKRVYTFKENMDEYSFLENIPEFILANRNHYKIFAHTMFKFLNDDERKNVVSKFNIKS